MSGQMRWQKLSPQSITTSPKTVWLPDKGDHAAIWDVDHAEYEKKLADFLKSVP